MPQINLSDEQCSFLVDALDGVCQRAIAVADRTDKKSTERTKRNEALVADGIMQAVQAAMGTVAE